MPMVSQGRNSHPFIPYSTNLTTPSPVLFTVSNLVISRAFPVEKQSIAGGFFNRSLKSATNSVGLAVCAAVASSVTDHTAQPQGTEPEFGLVKGYQAAFWLIFAAMIVVVFTSLWGFRMGGKVG
jgi:hypothetical protein